MEISGKTAIVTGAASGIGLGIATALAEAGANVVMADIRKDAVEQAACLEATAPDRPSCSIPTPAPLLLLGRTRRLGFANAYSHSIVRIRGNVLI
jgi:NAD(P)-dependent dehydrogenase (short-subunit alcohol dehydrogenase family)